MEQTRIRTFVTFALVGIFMLTLRWINQHWFITKPMSDTGFSYEMPRPKDARSAFDLSDRDVDSEVLENMEKNQADKAKKAAAAKAVVAPTAAKVGAKNAASSVGRSQQTTIDLVDTSRQLELSSSGNASHSETTPTSNVAPSTSAASAGAGSTTTAQSNSLTPAEWEVLMHGSPSSQTIASFASAHEKGEISDTDFYNIVFPMFTSSNTAWETTATSVMNDDNATNSLTYLTKEYQVQSVTTAQRTALWNIILGYASPVKFNALNADLKSGYEPGISNGLQVLTVAVQAAQSSASSSSSSSSSSSGRSVSGAVTGSSLEMFVATLQSLESTDTQDASTASSLISSIDALNKN